MRIEQLPMGQCDFVCKGVHFRIIEIRKAKTGWKWTVKNVETGAIRDGVDLSALDVEIYTGQKTYLNERLGRG